MRSCTTTHPRASQGILCRYALTLLPLAHRVPNRVSNRRTTMKIHLTSKEVAHALELLLKEKGTPMTIDPAHVGVTYGSLMAGDKTYDMEINLSESITVI